jgi:hypothetical protein
MFQAGLAEIFNCRRIEYHQPITKSDN